MTMIAKKTELKIHMSPLKKILFCFLLSGFGLSFADDAVRQFSSELMLIESKQVLSPDCIFKYSDAVEGENLKRLLNPSRIPAVVDVYLDELSKGVTEPNLLVQLDPLLKRYSKAFAAKPGEYEEEYLASQTWLFRFMQKGVMNKTPQSPASSNSTEESAAIQRLTDSLAKLNGSILALLAKNLRDQVKNGLFSAVGVTRAIELANSINSLPMIENQITANPTKLSGTRSVMSGEQVYKLACVACHATGAAGAPKSGDFNAWAPRIKKGLTSLLQASLKGKGAMGAQGGGDFLDVEIARATVYLVNTAGGKFLAPTMPVGQSNEVPVRPTVEQPRPYPKVPYADLDATQQLQYGERVYYSNCMACHQANGRAAGPIAALVNAPSLKTNDVAIQVVLNGRNRGAMPGWRVLSNEDIAAVINYIKAKFNNDVSESVRPEDVLNLRR